MTRVVLYVDGFNLYYGLRDSNFRRYFWLNLATLGRNLLKPYQSLSFVKYFTSRISAAGLGPVAQAMQGRRKRQQSFIEALETVPDLQIYYGHFLPKQNECRNCKSVWSAFEEKMTDVNIATEILTDAFRDRFDTALLVSGDSDLVGPIRAVQSLFPLKRVVVAFPPGRHSAQLKAIASGCFQISEARLKQSQFPDQVTKADGYVLNRPAEWK